MPETEVLFYLDDAGMAPVLVWLQGLRLADERVFAKCVARLRLLAEQGYELRRPVADSVREGIHELRVRHGRVNYRMLYFFSGRSVAVLAHALTKEAAIPVADMKRALERKRAFELDPDAHTYEEGAD